MPTSLGISMLTSLHIELMKLRKRLLTWILVALLIASVVLMPVLLYFVVSVNAYAPEGQRIPQGPVAELERATQLPGGMGMVFGVGGQLGIILFIILASVFVGNEYRWGTVRASLAHGRSRTDFVLAKLLALMMLGLVAMILTVAVGAGILALLTLLRTGSPDLGFLNFGFLTAAALGIVRAWFALLPFMLVATFLAIVTRSSWIAVALTLLYAVLVDDLTATLLGSLGEFWAEVGRFTISTNIQGLLAATEHDPAFGGSLAMMNPASILALPSPHRAFATLVGYCVVLLLGTLLIFHRRDVNVP